ncbi:hypothetical protein M513_00019 [Trichuris suis]|uniref:Uncharacterized protein n=1 Tax=Trichuris suis TaxID=68888 RepID=A0A085MNR0_9BILA|nr:hypothetical protein M513_00019 [Trichuris suis]
MSVGHQVSRSVCHCDPFANAYDEEISVQEELLELQSNKELKPSLQQDFLGVVYLVNCDCPESYIGDWSYNVAKIQPAHVFCELHPECLKSARGNTCSDTWPVGNVERRVYNECNEPEETAHEKRFRLAKKFLEEMKSKEEQRDYQEQVDYDAVAHRLEQEAPDLTYPEMRLIADSVILPSPSQIQVLRGHKLSVTSVALSADGRKVVSGSKDGDILIWDLETSAKIRRLRCKRYSHVGHDYVTSVAPSQDGNLLCSGGKDGRINIWDFETGEFLRTLQHEGGVTGLSVRTGHNQLFSCGADKSVKLWTLDGFGFVDSMYGHEAPIQDIDSLARQRAITCGGRDHTIRIWKVLEDSQLVFDTEKLVYTLLTSLAYRLLQILLGLDGHC